MALTKKQKQMLKAARAVVLDTKAEAEDQFQDCLKELGIKDNNLNVNFTSLLHDYLYGQSTSLTDIERALG